MKPTDITPDNLADIVKNHVQFKELLADAAAFEAVIKIRTQDGWDLFMLAALYVTSGRYVDLINAVSAEALSAAMSNMSDQNDHLLLLTPYYQGIENFQLLKSKISAPVLGKTLLFLAQQLIPDDFNQLVNTIGSDNSNALMLNALSAPIPRVTSKQSAMTLVSHNISLDILQKSIENNDNADLYEILNHLSPFKLNQLLKLISDKSVDLLKKLINGLNKHSLTKAVLIREQGNNLIMLMVENKKKSMVINVWIEALHAIGALNRVAVNLNQNKENLLMIALRHPEQAVIKKLIVLIHVTVLQKTLLSFLMYGLNNDFSKLWGFLDDKLRRQVLVDAAKNVSAIELKSFISKISEFMTEMLLSVSDEEFILLIQEIDPEQMADLLLNESGNKGKLIIRWNQLGQAILLGTLKIKNDNNSNVFMRLAKTLDADAFMALVGILSDTKQLVEVTAQTNNSGQDALMFAAYFQDANSFLYLVKSIQKENKLNACMMKKDNENNTALILLSEKKPVKIFSIFLGMLDSQALNYNLSIFFDNIKRSSSEDRGEKIAIAHVLKIHHLILNQSQEESAKPEDIVKINQSRSALKDVSFSSMSEILAFYQECFTEMPEKEMQQCDAAVIKVRQVLSTPYTAGSLQQDSVFSSLYDWLSGDAGKNKDSSDKKVMEHMGHNYK